MSRFWRCRIHCQVSGISLHSLCSHEYNHLYTYIQHCAATILHLYTAASSIRVVLTRHCCASTQTNEMPKFPCLCGRCQLQSWRNNTISKCLVMLCWISAKSCIKAHLNFSSIKSFGCIRSLVFTCPIIPFHCWIICDIYCYRKRKQG